MVVLKKSLSADDLPNDDSSSVNNNSSSNNNTTTTTASSKRGGGSSRRGLAWIRGVKSSATPSTSRRGGATAAASSKSSLPEDFGTPKTSNTTSRILTLDSNNTGTMKGIPTDKLAAPSLGKSASSTSTTPPSPPVGILRNMVGWKTSAKSSAVPKSTTTTTPSTTTPPSKKTKSKKTSWFCRTRYFNRLCDSAFTMVDSDGSGGVDELELYSGLLLIHLQLGMYAGPAACRPLSRDMATAVFRNMDHDNSGTLDRKEFRQVMAVLFGNVISRVVVQWSLTIMIVPWLAQVLLNGIIAAYLTIVTTIQNLDEHSEVANQVELTVEDVSEWCLAHTPSMFVSTTNRMFSLLALLPASVWRAVPLTVLSTLLGLVAVPWCIFQVDDYFQRMAIRKAMTVQNKNVGRWT